MDLAISKKLNRFKHYDKVIGFSLLDEDLITFETLEYTYLTNNQGNKNKGWLKGLRTMELKDFYNYYTILESYVLNEFLINGGNEL